MRMLAVMVAFAVLLVSCGQDPRSDPPWTEGSPSVESPETPASGALVERCVAGGTSHSVDPRSHDTLDAALGVGAGLAGLDVALLIAEDRSDRWIAGTSDDPVGVIELRKPDGGDVWFIDSVASCNSHDGHDRDPRIPAELPSGEVTALPAIVLVEGAEVGDIYTTGFAADAAAFVALWQELGLVGQPPSIEFSSRVVLYFGSVESSSCPLGPMEGLVYNDGTGSIHPLISPVASGQDADSDAIVCTADARRHAVLVAVERGDLPEGPFSLWISEKDPPGCCLDGPTFVAPGELNPPQASG